MRRRLPGPDETTRCHTVPGNRLAARVRQIHNDSTGLGVGGAGCRRACQRVGGRSSQCSPGGPFPFPRRSPGWRAPVCADRGRPRPGSPASSRRVSSDRRACVRSTCWAGEGAAAPSPLDPAEALGFIAFGLVRGVGGGVGLRRPPPQYSALRRPDERAVFVADFRRGIEAPPTVGAHSISPPRGTPLMGVYRPQVGRPEGRSRRSCAGAWGWQQLSSVARCEGSGLRPERVLGSLVQGFGCFGAGDDPLADLEEELLLAGR